MVLSSSEGSMAHPKSTLVSRNTLKKDILSCYQFEKKNMFNMLQDFDGRVSLTSDLWTSVATDGYISLTAHFITSDWVLHKKLLNFSYLPLPHTDITISEKIYKMLCEWNIESKLGSITLDNASSNDLFVATLRTQLNLRNALLCKGEFFHIRCCAHILNLIAQEGLKEMDESVVKIRESVKYIKGSQGRKEKFRECISSVALDKKRGLRQDVPTRWNSTFLMLESAIYYRHAFTHLQLTESNYKHGLSDDEWDKVEGICKFLSVFYNVTRLFSGSKYPTANLYFPNVFLVEFTLIKAVEDKNYIFVEFCYKILYGEDYEQIGKLYRALKALFDVYKDKIPSYSTTSEDFASNSFYNEGNNVLKEFDAIDEENSVALKKTELDKYLEEKRLNRNLEIDILDVGGRILDQYCSSLASNIVEMAPNFTLEELTEDIMNLTLSDGMDFGGESSAMPPLRDMTYGPKSKQAEFPLEK
ncbi:zinc finger BED domain-containing protein RICESLEEPER 2-like [Apium graveolens]|uniref:zinc finger BED domain-containing protein RICESLEEPER 2-like n=1 Tax=Apium graveolens TaxID=4045 RepID=UPI003D796232